MIKNFINKIKSKFNMSTPTSSSAAISTSTGPISIFSGTSNTLSMSSAGTFLTGQHISGLYSYPIIKQKYYVLCANKTSFNMFLTFGVDAGARDKMDLIFVEKIEDFDGNGYIKILNDFFAHPFFDDILKFIENNNLYLSLGGIGNSGTSGTSGTSGYVGIGGPNATTPNQTLHISSSSTVP